MRADLNFGMGLGADDPLHGLNLFLNVAGHRRDRLGDILKSEEFLRVNLAAPDELAVDVGEETFAELDACAGEHIRLEGDVRQMDILLERGGGFDFDQIPRMARHRHKDVHAGVAAAVGEGGLVNGATKFQGLVCPPDSTVEIAGCSINLDTAGKKLVRQRADFVALVKDGLRCLVRSRNLVFGIVAKPEQLRALPPHQEGGFGEIRLAGDWHRLWRVLIEQHHSLSEQVAFMTLGDQDLPASCSISVTTRSSSSINSPDSA